MDPHSTGPPVSVVEGSILHALQVTTEVLRFPPAQTRNWRCSTVYAGSRGTTEQLLRWFNTGAMGLRSAYAAEIALTIIELATILSTPLILRAAPEDFYDKQLPHSAEPGGLVVATAHRFFAGILPKGHASLGTRIGRLPWTKDEVKAHLKRTYRRDELAFMRLLEMEGSLACAIHRHLGVDRLRIKTVFSELRGDRKNEMIFANIICGTYFKRFNKKGDLLPVQCPLRVDQCTLSHLQRHLGREMPPR